jgi:hypothetical protein
MRLIHELPTCLLLASCALLGACVGRGRPPDIGGYQTAFADSVPGDIYAYPHTRYAAGYAYLVDGTWYYPGASGWLSFIRQPPELAQFDASGDPGRAALNRAQSATEPGRAQQIEYPSASTVER